MSFVHHISVPTACPVRIGKSLRQQLLVSLSVFSILLCLLLGYAAYRIALQETNEILDRQMQQMAQFLATSRLQQLDSTFKSDHQYDETDMFIEVWPVAATPLNTAKDYPRHAPIRLASVRHAGFYQFHAPLGELKAYVLPLADRHIQVSQLVSVRQHLAQELALSMLLPYLVLMPLVLVGVGWLIRHLLKPLSHLQQLIASRNPNDLTPVHIDDLPLEVVPAVNELNQLFEQIEQAKQQQQQFIADAAHELRSPITALNLQLTVLQKSIDYPLQHDRHFINLQQGLHRVQHLVTQMMALAHQDANPHIEYEALDLVEQTTLIMAQLMYSARRKNIDLGLASSCTGAPLIIHSNRRYLHSILANLIDNAIKYTPVDGCIDISVSHTADRVCICVEDSGTGVAAADYQQLVKRFVRLPSINHSQVGSGLGLSIVHTAVQHLGGELAFSRATLGGLAVTVRLPCKP